MPETYNLYNLEAPFKEYLVAGNQKAVSIKNYLSDVRHFFGWLTSVILGTQSEAWRTPESRSWTSQDDIIQLITSEIIQKYKSYLSENNIPHKTINRRLSTLRKFCSFCISQGWMKENPAKKIMNVKHTETTNKKQITQITKASVSPELGFVSFPRRWESKLKSLLKNVFNRLVPIKSGDKSLPPTTYPLQPNNLGFQQYIAFLIILIFMSVMGAGIYNQFFVKNQASLAYPTTPTKAGRILSFQGRLTDTLSNPITTATNVVFQLYSVSSGGTALYGTGTCSVTPDQDGIFSTLIGSDCGAEITSSVFSENVNVYLGVTIGGDAEMTPRQQIANVGYAINSETLQGLPPGTGTSVIPYINVDGNLLMSAASPGIRSTSTSTDFTLSSAKATVIQSAGTGDIVLQATESGSLIFRTGGATGANTRITVDNAGLVGIGTTAPTTTALLDLTSTTKGFLAPRMTTTERDLISTPATGLMIYNTTTNVYNVYNGSTWGAVGGGGGAFSDITSGTNTQAAMIVGTGASLNYTGTGTINASSLIGGTWAIPGTIGSTTPNTGAFTTLTSSGATTLGTGSSLTNTFGSGASSVNTIGSVTTPGALTLRGATTLDNTFTVSGSNLTSLGGNLTVTGTAWTATPTISGLITATSGLTANGALTANAAFTLGDNGDLGSVNTSDWDISTTGVMTGIGAITADGLFTGTAGTTITGAINLNATAGTNTTNIGTGTTTGLVTIGGGSGTFSLQTTNIDISSAGAITNATGFNGLVITPNTGTVTTGVWNATDISLAAGGTNASLSAVSGGIVYSGASALAISAAGTSGQFLISGGTGAPTWTSTVPATSLAWSSLTAPTTNLSFDHSTYTTAFNWATGTGTNNLFSLTTAASSNGTGSLLNLQTGTSSTVSPLRVRAGATEALFVKNDGNVGIGTTDPREKLSLAYDGKIGFAWAAGTPNVYNSIYKNGAATTFDSFATTVATTEMFRFNGSASAGVADRPLLSILNGGNVGIGTTGPSYALDVTGSVNLTGTLGIGTAAPSTARNINAAISFSDSNGFGIYNTSAISGTLSANRTNYGIYNLLTSSADNTSFTNALYGNWNQITNSAGYGYNTAIGSYNYVSNNDTTLTNTTTYGTHGYVLNNATGTLTNAYGEFGQVINNVAGSITNARGLYGYVRNDEGSMTNGYGVYGYAHQNVVGGTLSNAYGGYFNVTETAGTITSGYGVYIADIGGTTQYGLYQASATDTNYFAGNVGIGANDPDLKLTIAAPNATTNQLRLRSARVAIVSTNVIGGIDMMSNDTNLTAPGTIVASIQGLASQTHTASALGTDLVFNVTANTTTSPFEAMRILQSGNVGIGTTAPTSKLSVGASSEFQVDSTGNIVKINNVTTSFPASQGAASSLLVNNGSGTLTWGTIGAASITVDSLDFTEFQDTMDLDAALTLNQTTFTWTQNFTGTTTTGVTYNANSLTSGTAISLASTSTALTTGGLLNISATGAPAASWTGDLAKIEYNSADADVDGNALKVGLIGTTALGSGTALNVTSSQTGAGAFVLRVNDDGTYTDSTPFVVDINGNVGIGTTAPGTNKLYVSGGDVYLSNDIRAATFYDITGGDVYKLHPSDGGSSLVIAGNIVSTSSTFYIKGFDGASYNPIILQGSSTAGGTSVCVSHSGEAGEPSCLGKIDAGTVDPPYTINGKNYATFLSAMIGVKEETTGILTLNNKNPNTNVYESMIDFAGQPEASDLWLFAKVTDLKKHIDQMTVLLTPSENTRSWYKIDKENLRLYVYSSRPTNISYRLTAPRFDAESWSNRRADDDRPGFIINDQGNITGPPSSVSYNKPEISPQDFVYDGNIENFKQSNSLFTLTGDFVDEFTSVTEALIARLKAGFIEAENIIVNNTLIAKNIVSPIVETDKVITNEIKPQSGDLTIDLSSPVLDPLLQGDDNGVEKGALARLIIKGLEGKTAVVIDAAGNASFSGQIIADSLQINNDATVAGTLTANEASLSGNLIAKNIHSENISALEQSVSSVSQSVNSASLDINDIQALLADIKNQPIPDANYYQNLDSSVILGSEATPGSADSGQARMTVGDLTVTGNSNLYNVSVSNSLLVGTTLIDQNSIISLASELKLSALSTINLFDGAVIIAKDGKITTRGEIIAEGGIRTDEIKPLTDNGQVTINNLAIDNLTINSISTNSAIIAAPDNFAENGIFAPAIETATASAGIGTLPENSQEVIIYNNTIKENSLIYLTPTSTSASISQLTVGEKNIDTKPYFKVISNTPSILPIKFNWLIIN